MQERNFAREPFAKNIARSNRSASTGNGRHLNSTIICTLIPDSESAVTVFPYSEILGTSGAAYLVMDPGIGEHSASDLQAIIQSGTTQPVLIPAHGTPVEADHVYLVPSGMSLYDSGEKILFRNDAAPLRGNGAVDLFLATIAAVLPDRHIVVLPQSNVELFTGGLRVVQAQGGFVLAFSEDDALVVDRPGLLASDLTLSPAETGSRLGLLLRGIGKEPKPELKSEHEDAELAYIYLRLLRNRGMDFARRQQGEIIRRIRRRMLIHAVNTLKEYSNLVMEETEELALFEELRISLAGFSLDATVEHALLNDVLPRVIEQHRTATPLRIWIPCCGGGHEAYAMAIFLSDYLREQKREFTVQIFATDLNKAALERSRTGVYSAAELAGLSARKRKQYFTRSPLGYHINREIREMCVFATQNLFKDPPYPNIDIIIGFSAIRGLASHTVSKVFHTFHYALRATGYLLLDETEAGSASSELFQCIRFKPAVFVRKEKIETAAPLYTPATTRTGERQADNILLTAYVPPALLIDERLRVIRFYGNTEPYIRYSQDRPSLHLLRMIRDELIFEFDHLIERSNKEGGTVIKNGIHIGTGVNARVISVEITPLRPARSKWKLVIFREIVDTAVYPTTVPNPSRTLAQKELRIQSLEKEAVELRSLLVATSEDATRTQRSSQLNNEEIMASNEELLSINEQLESVNLQLVSSNIELKTVNEDLSVRNRTLELSMEYAHAIVGALRQPMVVLHEDLNIRMANESFCAFFRVSAREIQKRSLYAMANSILDRDELHKALEALLSGKSNSADVELQLDLAHSGRHVIAISVARMPKVREFHKGLILSLEDITICKSAEIIA